ncbi:MAG TPA: hypothetical protein HPP66_06740 [Planctomycetes bacterium]|nr:hypothetical protein [Planctomycetota bacterium]
MNLGHLDFDIVSNFVLRISYFSYRDTNFPSTTVENALQIAHFMQNKPNFRKAKMNVNMVLTVDYEKKTLGQRGKNKPNSNPIQTQSNPIKANKMPKQTQNKPKQTQSVVSLPALPALSAAEGSAAERIEPISEAKKSCCRGNPHASHRAGAVAKIKIVTVSLTLPGIDANLLALQFKEDDLWNCPG